MKIYSKFSRIFLTFLISIFLLACSSDSKLSTESWCSDVRSQLEILGVGWPVAQKTLSLEQAKRVEEVMRDMSDKAHDEDLLFASKVWVEKYNLIYPYIVGNDLEGFYYNVNKNDQEAMHLANVSISNFCQWESW
ncbi:hypothetical protein [Rothia nasimurium]|uniref:hypothetical protein n=1 Tax=Rothia nasimurium TaxID=85336 RepID=UPI002DD61E47|nr:hypothetical protein [Rothia nasimurium]